MAKFQFGNVVVVEEGQIGVIVKSWDGCEKGYNYDVYVRNYNRILNYKENDIQHFIYSKELSSDEQEYYA